jgi:hypothetical protein
MVRSIGPIGKKAGLYARVPASWPAAQGPQPVPAQPPQAGPRRQQALQQTCQWPSQPLWALPGQRRLSPRREPPWRPPWICWCRLSLPGLLAVRAGPSCIHSQGRVASLPGSRTCSQVLAGARLYRPPLTRTETLQIQHKRPGTLGGHRRHQTRLCSSPWRKMSLGRSMPMKTILLNLGSPSAHWGPRSLPISWCTPWKITLRSVPFILSTPL